MGRIEDLIAEKCPNGVRIAQLKEISVMKRGTSATRSTMSEGDIPVVSGGKEPAFYCDTWNRDGETITVAGSGAGAGFVKYWNEPIFVNDAFSVKGIDGIAGTKFIYYCLANMQDKIYATKTGGGIPHVHIKDIENFRVPVQPLDIQKEIVAVLDSFTELEAELEARRKQYGHYRDQLLSFENLSTDGGQVEWLELGDVCEKVSGVKWSEGDSYKYIDLSSVNRNDNSICSDLQVVDMSNAPSRARQIVRAGDVLFGTTRPTLMRFCRIPTELDGQICSTGYCVLRPNTKKVLSDYVYYHISLSAFKNYCEENQKGASYPAISDSEVKKYQIPIPSLAVQKKIVNTLMSFDAVCNDLSFGLPAEIEARRKQYVYYRDKLLTFKEKTT